MASSATKPASSPRPMLSVRNCTCEAIHSPTIGIGPQNSRLTRTISPSRACASEAVGAAAGARRCPRRAARGSARARCPAGGRRRALPCLSGRSSRAPQGTAAGAPRAAVEPRRVQRRARRSRSAYLSLTTLRLTFSDGVSSPVSWERSWSRIVNFLTCSTWAYFALALSSSAWMSSCTFGSVGERGHVGRQALLLGPGHDLLLVERHEHDGVGPAVAVHDRLRDPAALRRSFSRLAGVRFLPPAVMMMSFLRPVIER